MGFPNIAIILRILFGVFQVFCAIFRDFLGFWDLVRFWDFSKDFFFIFDEVYEDFQSNLPLALSLHVSKVWRCENVLCPFYKLRNATVRLYS